MQREILKIIIVFVVVVRSRREMHIAFKIIKRIARNIDFDIAFKNRNRILLHKIELVQIGVINLGLKIISDFFFAQIDQSVEIEKQIRVVDKHFAFKNGILEFPVDDYFGVCITVVFQFIDIA